jgi:hypothetical protein
MKRETKLWLRKHSLMALRAIVWHVDEWIQRQEVALRNDLSPIGMPQAASHHDPASVRSARTTPVASPRGESFEQWEMRKSGVRPVTKRIHRRRYRPTAAEFDSSVIDRRKDWLQ